MERVIVLKLDRLTRSTGDLAALLELFANAGSALVSIGETLDTSSAAGRMVVNMLGVVAQWEREAISERTAIALAHKRQLRTAYGATPFGFLRIGDALVPEPREQDALGEATRLRSRWRIVRQIAAMLTKRGTMPHRGRAWYASSVRAVLRSRMATEGGPA